MKSQLLDNAFCDIINFQGWGPVHPEKLIRHKKGAWRKERNRAKKGKKAKSEFLRKGKASEKVITKNAKQGKRNFQSA